MRSGATGSGPGYGGAPSGSQGTARTQSDPRGKVRKFGIFWDLNSFSIMGKELQLSTGNRVEEYPLRNRPFNKKRKK